MEAEQPAEETKVCGICTQQIAVSKFRMHDIGCSRQNYKCKDCQQCVAKADKDEHEEEEHKEVKCEQCGFIARNYAFKGHYLSCSQKPQECKFCNKEIAFYQINEHYQLCGGKTTKCPDCGEYVKNVEQRDHKQDGLCEVIAEQKRDQAEVESKKELEKYQQKYLAQLQKDGPIAYEQPPITAPKPVVEVPAQVIQPRPANPQPEIGSSLEPVAQPAAVEGNLDDYDQMIFNQFMEDENEALAKQLQEGGGGNTGAFGGSGGGQNQPDLNIRKADSEKFTQLFGGQEENDFSGPQGYGQYSMPQGFSMGGSIAHGTEMIGGGNFQSHGGLGPQVNNNNFGSDQNMDEGGMGNQNQNAEDEIQKAIQASLEGAQQNDIPMTEDEEMARAIEASMKNQ